MFEDLINYETINKWFLIKFVVVDIPFSSDVIIGLKEIQKFGIFRLLPHLVEASIELIEEDSEGDESEGSPSLSNHIPTKLCAVYGSEWIDEEPYVKVPDLIYDDDDIIDEDELLYESMISTIDDLSNSLDGMSFGQRAYERDDISEIDHDRFEAFSPEAIQEHVPSIPKKSSDQLI